MANELNIGELLGGFGGWINGFWMLVLAIFVIFILTIVFLLWNRNKKFMYPGWEVLSFGNGKIGLNKVKVGSFSKNRVFFNLVERPGEKGYYTNDFRPIQCASTEDCQKEVTLDKHGHIINGQQGFLLKRKDGDPKMLAPIDKVQISNYDMIASVASGDYRDAASRLYEEKKKEMQGTWEKVAPLVVGGIIFVLCFVAIIITVQSSATQLDESRKFLLQCRGGVPNAASNAP
jgi:uncharacterized integral membrane protein